MSETGIQIVYHACIIVYAAVYNIYILLELWLQVFMSNHYGDRFEHSEIRHSREIGRQEYQRRSVL